MQRRSLGETELWKLASIFILSSVRLSGVATAQSVTDRAQPSIVHVDATPGHAINSFDPDSALGSSIDVLSHDAIDRVFTPHIIQESLSAGWGIPAFRVPIFGFWRKRNFTTPRSRRSKPKYF